MEMSILAFFPRKEAEGMSGSFETTSISNEKKMLIPVDATAICHTEDSLTPPRKIGRCQEVRLVFFTRGG